MRHQPDQKEKGKSLTKGGEGRLGSRYQRERVRTTFFVNLGIREKNCRGEVFTEKGRLKGCDLERQPTQSLFFTLITARSVLERRPGRFRAIRTKNATGVPGKERQKSTRK